MAMDSVDARIATQAVINHGAIAAAGVEASDRQLRGRAVRGALERAEAGVYVLAGVPRSHLRLLAVACLAAGPDAVASHRAAAWLWKFDGFRNAGPIELTVELGRGPVPKAVIMHRSKRFDPLDRTVENGIPVTTRERTLIDLGAVVRPALVHYALDSYLRKGGSETKLRRRLDAVAGRGCRGVGILRAILDGKTPDQRPSGSPIEIEFLLLCREYGLPEPVPQFAIQLFDGSVLIVDWAWPQYKAVVELDGYDAHNSRAEFENLHRRPLVLRQLGYRYLGITGMQVFNEPGFVIDSLRAEVPELFRFSTL
jgi:hypothetical protein